MTTTDGQMDIFDYLPDQHGGSQDDRPEMHMWHDCTACGKSFFGLTDHAGTLRVATTEGAFCSEKCFEPVRGILYDRAKLKRPN